MSYERRTKPRQSEPVSTVLRISQCVLGQVTVWRRAVLLLAGDALQILRSHCKEAAELLNPLIGDIPGRVTGDGLIQKFLGLLVIGLCYIQGVFKGGFMF